LRERVKALLESQFEQVAFDLAGLEPKEGVNVWLKLSEFVLPKLQRSETVIMFLVGLLSVRHTGFWKRIGSKKKRNSLLNQKYFVTLCKWWDS